MLRSWFLNVISHPEEAGISEKWLIPGLRKGRYKSLEHFVRVKYKEVLTIFDKGTSKGKSKPLEEAPSIQNGTI